MAAFPNYQAGMNGRDSGDQGRGGQGDWLSQLHAHLQQILGPYLQQLQGMQGQQGLAGGGLQNATGGQPPGLNPMHLQLLRQLLGQGATPTQGVPSYQSPVGGVPALGVQQPTFSSPGNIIGMGGNVPIYAPGASPTQQPTFSSPGNIVGMAGNVPIYG
jgi:hypothetical protein